MKLPLPWRRAKVEIRYFLRLGGNPVLHGNDPPSHEISVEEARKLYGMREEHVALVLRARQPHAAVWSRDDLIFVSFYDALVREYLRYEFMERMPGRMFLELASHVEFDGETRDIAKEEIYLFTPSGEMIIRERTASKAEPDTESVADDKVDVSGNWEPYPAFGEYAGLLRIDRS
jgi:hypothetical protein